MEQLESTTMMHKKIQTPRVGTLAQRIQALRSLQHSWQVPSIVVDEPKATSNLTNRLVMSAEQSNQLVGGEVNAEQE